MALFHRHKQVDAVLTAVAWRRSTTLQHADWRPESSDTKPHGDNVRNVHWGGQGVGDEPWKYEERHWREGRVVETSGDSQEGVHWAEFSLWPEERVHRQTESYTATFSAVDDSVPEDEKTIQAELHEDVWRTLSVGTTYRLELNVLGHVRHVVPV